MLGQIEDEVIRPSVEGLTKDNMDFRGFLYAGLMLTPDGPKLLEYNCRFGDPEAQAVLPLIKGDFAAYLMSAAKGNLMDGLIDFDKGWSICLVLASAGYPSSSRSGDVINGLDLVDGVRVYHAGTEKNNDGQYVTNGGRVLAVVGHGETRETALECSYTESEKISFDGNQRRSDIGRLHF
ncbi:MAG: phosphoribosylamine--glycine ligase [Verrucomicrobiales bacterium]